MTRRRVVVAQCASLPPQGTLWEGGIRVPLILRWPAGSSLPARTSAQVAMTFDLTASILAPLERRCPRATTRMGSTCCPSCGVTPRWSNAGSSGASIAQSPAAGRQVRSLEAAGRRRPIPAVRSRRRPGRTHRSRPAASGHRRHVEGRVGRLGEGCQSRSRTKMTPTNPSNPSRAANSRSSPP